MRDSDDGELRRLQSAVYGRSGTASHEEIQRLAELQAVDQDVTAPPDTATEVGDDAALPLVHDDTPIRRGASIAQRWILAGVVAGSLVLGGVAGAAIVSSFSRAPIESVVPPLIDQFQPESVVYFGEYDGIQVWSASERETGDRCLIADQGGVGSIACRDASQQPAQVLLTSEDGQAVHAIALDLFDPNARPEISTAQR